MLVNKIKSGIIGASLALTGCGEPTSVDNAQRYMENNNKSQIELENIIKYKNDKKPIEVSYYTGVQSKLDSVAYRDVFMTTQASKNSSKVAEFNKIAAKGKMTSDNPTQKLMETNISVKEFKRITKSSSRWTNWYENVQYATDSINYRKFFKGNKLLDKKTLNLFNKVSQQIKP